MSAPLSVIIPTLNAAHVLPETLAALMEGVDAGVIRELVISDGGSEDATIAIAEEAGGRVLTGSRGRGAQLRQAAEAARGDWLLLLHADTWLSPGWTDAVTSHMAGSGESVGYFRLAFRARGIFPRLVAEWANLRSRLFGLPYGDQGLLIHRDLLERIGGVPPLDLMEDVALVRALKGRLLSLPAVALTSAERYEQDGWIRRGARNLWTLIRYLLGADPAKLARDYARSSASRN